MKQVVQVFLGHDVLLNPCGDKEKSDSLLEPIQSAADVWFQPFENLVLAFPFTARGMRRLAVPGFHGDLGILILDLVQFLLGAVLQVYESCFQPSRRRG